MLLLAELKQENLGGRHIESLANVLAVHLLDSTLLPNLAFQFTKVDYLSANFFKFWNTSTNI